MTKHFKPIFLSDILRGKMNSSTKLVLKPRTDLLDQGLLLCHRMRNIYIEAIDFSSGRIRCRSEIMVFELSFDKETYRLSLDETFIVRNIPRIETVYEYNEFACELVDEFLDTFNESSGLTRTLSEDYDDDSYLLSEGAFYAYTDRAMRLYERYCDRLYKLGCRLFPDDIDDLDIESKTMIT